MPLLAGLAACGGQDATTLSSTTGAQEAGAPSDATPAPAPSAPADVVRSQHVKTERQLDGSFASEVNATDMQSWVRSRRWLVQL